MLLCSHNLTFWPKYINIYIARNTVLGTNIPLQILFQSSKFCVIVDNMRISFMAFYMGLL